jgi:tRNA (cytidine/uridine-2'-O-)-methyltransferase
MLHVILYQPEIPPNTGNIIRLCANAGARLHLVGPLGFALDDKRLIRAGLDYHEYTDVQQYPDWQGFLTRNGDMRITALSTRGSRCYSEFRFVSGDGLLFGSETRGLPQPVLDQLGKDRVLTVPMIKGSRSLNLSNTVAVVLYEAWRQLGFAD